MEQPLGTTTPVCLARAAYRVPMVNGRRDCAGCQTRKAAPDCPTDLMDWVRFAKMRPPTDERAARSGGLRLLLQPAFLAVRQAPDRWLERRIWLRSAKLA